MTRPRRWSSPGRRDRPRSSPTALEGDQVADFRANVRAAATASSGWCKHHEQPLDERDPASYQQSCLELAQTGHDLYNQVFDRAARDGEHIDEIAGWLRDLTSSGQVESLEVVCDGQPWFAPWNLVYDEEPEDSAFDGAAWRAFAPFWGMRYNICGGQPVDPLRRMPLPTKPQVLVVIDPVVLDDLQTYQDATARPSATGSSGSSAAGPQPGHLVGRAGQGAQAADGRTSSTGSATPSPMRSTWEPRRIDQIALRTSCGT